MDKKTSIRYRYSEAFKQQVVSEIDSGRYTIAEAKRAYGIKGGGTVQNWARKMGNLGVLTKTVRVEKPDEKDRIKALEAEIVSERGKALLAAIATQRAEYIAVRKTFFDALKAGECDTATRLLTRPFTIEAVVQHGDKNGRLLGFPTANMDLGKYLRPRYGVYAVRGRLPDGRLLDGAACHFVGSQRQWRVRLIPLGPDALNPAGFELLLIAEEPLADPGASGEAGPPAGRPG